MRRLYGTTVLSTVGLTYHQLMEFPRALFLNLLVVGSMIIVLIGLVLLAGHSSFGYWTLLFYALTHLIGGGLSVIPFWFLSFVPDQSSAHYFSHLIYALTQLPLMYVVIKHLTIIYSRA